MRSYRPAGVGIPDLVAHVVHRRRLLRGTVAILGATALSALGFSRPAQANVWVTMLKQGAIWLGTNVLAPVAVQELQTWIDQTPILRTPVVDFHSQFSTPVQFADNFPLSPTNYSSYFGIQNHPVLTGSDQYEHHADLNPAEIGELANQQRDPQSVLHTAGPTPKLLPAMAGDRRPPNEEDRADLSELVADTIESRGHPRPNPDDVADLIDLKYVREFCSCIGPITGYASRAINGQLAENDYTFGFYRKLG